MNIRSSRHFNRTWRDMFQTLVADFLLTLARWPMASEHCRRTSDFLSYWPGLASGISKTVVVVCVLLTHFCFNVRLFSQVCFICFIVRLF